jgi:pimeloyl-ACP methyl ester carboxylesterase
MATRFSAPSRESRGAQTVHAAPPIGRLYDVDGRRLLLHRSGSGGPAVVFAPGAGLIGLDYLNVHDRISRFTTSVLYDRAGTGWSDEIQLPRSAAEVTDELRALLRAAEIPAPYLLIGHSLGGVYVRRYAQRYPQEVAGLLFLDPAHEDYPAHTPKLTLLGKLRMGLALVSVMPRFRRFYGSMFRRMFAEWPDPLREVVIEYHLKAWRKTLLEGKNLGSELLDEIRRGGPMPDVPLIVLSATGIDPFMAAFAPESYLRALNPAKHVMYTSLAGSVPRGEHRALENAGHSTIHTDQPDAVVQAIRDLLERVRR